MFTHKYPMSPAARGLECTDPSSSHPERNPRHPCYSCYESFGFSFMFTSMSSALRCLTGAWNAYGRHMPCLFLAAAGVVVGWLIAESIYNIVFEIGTTFEPLRVFFVSPPKCLCLARSLGPGNMDLLLASLSRCFIMQLRPYCLRTARVNTRERPPTRRS